jgi:hypothetical protein
MNLWRTGPSWCKFFSRVGEMRSLRDLIDVAKRLAPEDRLRLLETIEESLSEVDESGDGAPRKSPYANMLRVAGTIHSDFADVSSDKYKHLSEDSLGQSEE